MVAHDLASNLFDARAQFGLLQREVVVRFQEVVPLL
jgi:hypothetical protein